MTNKKFTILTAMLATIVALLVCIVLQLADSENIARIADNTQTIAKNMPQVVECGACGARVTEYHRVRNDGDTAWVNVCNDCYAYAESNK